MAIRRIARMGNPVLNQVATRVDDPTAPDVARLAGDMKDTLVDIGGSGIAAPQVYESVRLVVYRLTSRLAEDQEIAADPWTVMVNPELTPLGADTLTGWERCLSIPGLHGKVSRPARLRLVYTTLTGETVEREVDGAHATLLQHECDHLDGILYPMRMDDISKLEFDAEPGHLAADMAAGVKIWPVLRKLVEDWPGREQWMDRRAQE